MMYYIGFLATVVLFVTEAAADHEWPVPISISTSRSEPFAFPADKDLSTAFRAFAGSGVSAFTFRSWSTGRPFTGGDNGWGDNDFTSGTTTINISVTNVNEPIFGSSQYTACIIDGSVSDTYLTTVLATDADSCDEVTHKLASGNRGNDFKIDQTTGVIQVNTAKIIDKAKTSWYSLVVEADDGHWHTSKTIVKVKVDDSCSGTATFGISMAALLQTFLVTQIYLCSN